MKTNKKTYVDIEEIMLCGKYTYYKVSFITTYDITLFGKYIKTKTKIEEVPFWFQSLDIAKDFCEVNPKIYHTYFYNDDYYNRSVYYETYKLEVDKQYYYIKWTKWSMKIVDSTNFSFDLRERCVVDEFVSNIILKSWYNTNDFNDINYSKGYLKLSELVTVKTKKDDKNDNNKHWKFELVKNEDE